MIRRIAVGWHPDADIRGRWLRTWQPDAHEASGEALLCAWGAPLSEGMGGRAVAALAGTVFNDLELGARLTALGHEVQIDDHGRIAADAIARFGPDGLGALRMQGVVACLHRGQGAILAARCPVGIGQLYVRNVDGGTIIASDASLLPPLDPAALPLHGEDEPLPARWCGATTADPQTRRVPAGLAVLVGRRGVSWVRIRHKPNVMPWMRAAPDALRTADPATVAVLIADALRDALDATRRGRGSVWASPPRSPYQRWLLELGGVEPTGAEGHDCQWSLLGARTLCEAMRWPRGVPGDDDGARVAAIAVSWRKERGRHPDFGAVPLPEPIDGLPIARAAQRWLRYTAFSNGLAARAWHLAATAEQGVAWPHLDPRVLAITGSVPHATLQAAVGRVPVASDPPSG